MNAPSRSLPASLPRDLHSAPVAQLDRASDFESEGRPFESVRAYQVFETPRSRGKSDARFKLKTDSVSGPLAQLVEQWTLNPLAEGSSPSWPTQCFPYKRPAGPIFPK